MRRRRPLSGSVLLPSRWRRHGVKVLALAVATLVLVYHGARRQPIVTGGDAARYHDHTCRVVHVVDGDTLDVDIPDGGKLVTRIRLWGVDTPEVAHGGNPTMYFGPEAKDFAKQTLEGRDVQIVLSPEKTRDKYGRLLAYVFLERGGPLFNEMLLEQGYAYADLRFRHSYGKQFQADERRARRAKVGLWANVTLDNMPAWRRRFETKGQVP